MTHESFTAVSRGYRVDPSGVRAMLAAVLRTPVDRTAVPDALQEAAERIQSVDDGATDRVVFAVTGMAGDLLDAVASIDSRIGAAAEAVETVLGAVETGDAEMADQIRAAASATDPAVAARFGGRKR